jgi:hypothetical protein
MKLVTVSAGQSLVDVCLQELGTVAALFALADANNRSLTDPLSPGEQLLVPETVLSLPAVANYYAGRQQRVNVPDPLRPAGSLVPPVAPDKSHDFLSADTLRKDVY